METVKNKFSIKSIWEVLKDTAVSFSDDKITKLSASLAYYTVFSMGPLLVVIISLCGIFLKRDAIEGKINNLLRDFVGADTAKTLEEIVKNAALSSQGRVAAVIGLVTLLIGATSVFAEIQDSINSIWGIKPKPKRGWLKYIQNRFLSFSVIVSLGFLLLVSLTITGIIEGVNSRLQDSFPAVTIVVFYILNVLVTLSVSCLIFAVIFRVLPDADIKWRDVFTGALVTAVLFLLGKFGISFYISQTKVGSTYGAAGSLVILLVWVYYSSIILYFGAEFTKAYAMKFGSSIRPNSYAVTTKQVEIETGEATVQQNEKAKDKIEEGKVELVEVTVKQ